MPASKVGVSAGRCNVSSAVASNGGIPAPRPVASLRGSPNASSTVTGALPEVRATVNCPVTRPKRPLVAAVPNRPVAKLTVVESGTTV